MNVTCTGCPAKYAVLDEKVRGKKVRIACKHCGTNILVDGTAMDADPAQAAHESQGAAVSSRDVTGTVPEAVAAKPKAVVVPREVSFLVGFLDDRQESHTLSHIIEMYRTGLIDDEALVWKDGMPDWLSPFDVPEIAAAMLKSGVARRATQQSPVMPMQFDDEATRIRPSPLENEPASERPVAPVVMPTAPVVMPTAPVVMPTAPVVMPTAPAVAPRPAVTPQPAVAPIQPTVAPTARAVAPIQPTVASSQPGPISAAVAARRTEKRSAAVDLFGTQAGAGSENDASLDFGPPADPVHKLTGARNESSVLFSLDALTKLDAKSNQTQKAREKEQETQASAVLFGDAAPSSLLNVGSGGLAELAAPDFTKPVTAAPGPDYPSNFPELQAPRAKQKGGAILLVALLGIAAAAGFAFAMMQKQPLTVASSPPATEPTSAGSAVPSVAGTAEGHAVAEPSAALSATPAPRGEASTSAAIPSTPKAGLATPVAARPTAARPASGADKRAADKPAADKPAADKPASATAAVDKPASDAAGADKPAAPAAGAEGPAFDKAAAVAALSGAAANAGSCKKPDGPTGTGKVSVTFAPSGRATATNVVGALAGTEVGGCVARLFRSARVPPFSGDPVTVSKSFSIE